MGLYLRPSRFLKVRVTRGGVRWAIGPRCLRLRLGSGGAGLSTGAGPVSVHRGLRRRRSARPGARRWLRLAGRSAVGNRSSGVLTFDTAPAYGLDQLLAALGVLKVALIAL